LFGDRVTMKSPRIGFLFNHYATHQVPHAAPYAFELSRRHKDFEVVIATSTRAEENAVRAIAALYPGQQCELVRLRPAWWYSLADPVVSKSKFKRKKRILNDNLDFFKTLDALVAPERHCRRLRTRFGLSDLVLIFIRATAPETAKEPQTSMSCFLISCFCRASNTSIA
jgi:hypothetical protein